MPPLPILGTPAPPTLPRLPSLCLVGAPPHRGGKGGDFSISPPHLVSHQVSLVKYCSCYRFGPDVGAKFLLSALNSLLK